MAKFFWNDQKNSHKCHLSNWQSLARKDHGEMGIPDLRDLNLCLPASWVQRYQDADGKIWKKIIDHKYQISPNIFCCNPRNTSHFWEGVICAAHAAKLGYRWHIGDCRRVRFWEDV
jgi:hypothetical protein